MEKQAVILPPKLWNKPEIIHRYSHRSFAGITAPINSIPAIQQDSKSLNYVFILLYFFIYSAGKIKNKT